MKKVRVNLKYFLSSLSSLSLAIFALSSSSVHAQQGAKDAGSSHNMNGMVMGATSTGTGSILMAKTAACAHAPHPDPTCRMMFYVLGPSMIITGGANILQAAAGQAAANNFSPGGGYNPQDSSVCTIDPELCANNGGSNPNGGGNGDGGPNGGSGGKGVNTRTDPNNVATSGNPGGHNSNTIGGSNPQSMPPEVAAMLAQAQAEAQKHGVDLSDPASVKEFNDKAMKEAGGADGSMPSLSGLPGSVQAEIAKSIKDMQKRFASLSPGSLDGTDGGGGGRMFGTKGRGGGDNFDINAFLKGMDGKEQARSPASVEGLQKSFNGEPIGVAGDNIFRQVSRRYQIKIQSKIFLPPTR